MEANTTTPTNNGAGPMDVDHSEELKLAEVTQLSKNAIRDICDPALAVEVRGKIYILQAIDVKVFTEADNKKNIRQRYYR